jgi:cell division protein FtsB
VAGHSSSTQSQRTPERTRLRVPARALSLRTAIILFVGLLILFRWLHLILALQLASTGRQIQIATEELHKIERYNTSLVREISEAESPANLASRALEEGYGPRKLIYLRTDLPLARPESGVEGPLAADQGGAAATAGASSLVPWDALNQQSGVGARAEAAP